MSEQIAILGKIVRSGVDWRMTLPPRPEGDHADRSAET